MQLKLALLADYANITAEGKLNILGIFDRIQVAALPAVHPVMQLILRLDAHAAERNRPQRLEIRLHDPDGQTVFDIGGDVMVQGGAAGGPLSTNQIIGINNLQLAKSGEYSFIVFINNDLKAEIPLVVKVASLPPGRSAPTH